MDLLTVAWNSLHSEPPLQPRYENNFPNASPNYYEKKRSCLPFKTLDFTLKQS